MSRQVASQTHKIVKHTKPFRVKKKKWNLGSHLGRSENLNTAGCLILKADLLALRPGGFHRDALIPNY